MCVTATPGGGWNTTQKVAGERAPRGPERVDRHERGGRVATEDLLLVRSAYVQPIGRFEGALPDPTGHPVEVSLTGVTEDHRARR